MPQAAFTTAHKCLTYYVDCDVTRDLEQLYGSHLQNLTQLEKYQIITSLSMWLWYLTEPETAVEESLSDELDELFEEEEDEPFDGQIAAFWDEGMPADLSPDARDVLNRLDFVDPEHLANLLPAIALYAAEDGRR
jgi:hypothetical protein